jgi:hypothetical protein
MTSRAARLRCLPLLALLAAPAAAAAQDAPLAAALAQCFEQGGACAALTDPAAPSEGPETPAAGRREDPRLQLLTGAFITAASADLAVTMYQIGRGAARERGFGAWWQDEPVPFALTKSGMAAIFVYGLQRMHRTRPKTAFVIGLVATAAEAALVVHGARMKPRPR